MKLKQIFIISLGVILFSSCAVTVPFAVTNNTVGKKTGVSSTLCFFTGMGAGGTRVLPHSGALLYHGIMSNSNFGIVEAAKKGKIDKIGSVDLKTTSYLFFIKREFIVTGE